ncbi:MAG: hypothetical protein J6D52_02665, partial [Clostridia bacterium]|nr:hypothetical protein [Clostridia bacterium]
MKEHFVIKILAILGITVFAAHQIYSSVYKPITTESAVAYTATDGLNITGVLIRQEQIVSSDDKGVLHFETSDGSRVAKGGVIANVYSDAEDSV